MTSDQHHARQHDHSAAADGTPIAVAGVPGHKTTHQTGGADNIDAILLDNAYAAAIVFGG